MSSLEGIGAPESLPRIRRRRIGVSSLEEEEDELVEDEWVRSAHGGIETPEPILRRRGRGRGRDRKFVGARSSEEEEVGLEDEVSDSGSEELLLLLLLLLLGERCRLLVIAL